MSSEQALQSKTIDVALRIIKLVETLPAVPVGKVIGHQVLRSGTSIGANYRAAARAKSKADILNKLKIRRGGSGRDILLAPFARQIKSRS